MKRNPARKILHVVMVVFALLIGRTPPSFMVGLCMAAILFNVFFLPSIGRGLFLYSQEAKSRLSIGLITYPASLFIASLVFYTEQAFLAVAWGILAFGDGSASLLSSGNGQKLPWNSEKTWRGLIYFNLFGFLGTYGLILLLPASISGTLSGIEWALVIGSATLVASIFESIEGFIDDNISVVPASGVTAFVISAALSQPEISFSGIPLGQFAFCLAFGIVALTSKSLTVSGAVTGALVALAIALGFGWPGLVFLGTFVAGGTLASKLPERSFGKAHEIRNYQNVLGNGGIAAFLGLAAWLVITWHPLLIGMAAASLGAAFSDTLSSEIGTRYGQKFFRFPSFKDGVPGDDGVVSLVGTAAGVVGASLMGLLFWFFSHDSHTSYMVAASALAGNVIDSALGNLQKLRLMNNHTVNFSMTGAASFVFWLVTGTGLGSGLSYLMSLGL